LREIRDQRLGKDVPYCINRFAVYSIDPRDGAATQLFKSKGATFGASTAAVKTGDSIYLGAVGGNRIAKIALP